MNTTFTKLSPFQLRSAPARDRQPKLSAREQANPSRAMVGETLDLSEAARSSKKTSSKALLKSAGVMLMTGMSLIGGLTGGASPAMAQSLPNGAEVVHTTQDYNGPVEIVQQDGRPTKGVKYDYTRAEVEAAVRNTVTADDLTSEDFRFTAKGVDDSQLSKEYHEPDTLETRQEGHKTIKHKNRSMMCAKEKNDKCRSKFPVETQHSVLSCVYRNEADGQLYRVVQRSESYSQTKAMKRNVCGGHDLRITDGVWTPHQESKDGDTLYVNPDNIVQVRTLTEAEQAKYGG